MSNFFSSIGNTLQTLFDWVSMIFNFIVDFIINLPSYISLLNNAINILPPAFVYIGLAFISFLAVEAIYRKIRGLS